MYVKIKLFQSACRSRSISAPHLISAGRPVSASASASFMSGESGIGLTSLPDRLMQPRCEGSRWMGGWVHMQGKRALKRLEREREYLRPDLPPALSFSSRCQRGLLSFTGRSVDRSSNKGGSSQLFLSPSSASDLRTAALPLPLSPSLPHSSLQIYRVTTDRRTDGRTLQTGSRGEME